MSCLNVLLKVSLPHSLACTFLSLSFSLNTLDDYTLCIDMVFWIFVSSRMRLKGCLYPCIVPSEEGEVHGKV